MQSEDNNDDDEWTDEAFDEFYDKLVDVKHDEGYQEQCSRIFDYAGHMFSLVCSFVLSDLEKDLENRRGNPLAKSYPGKLKVYYYLKISSAEVNVAYVLFIPFFVFGHFWRKYNVIFVYILQGKMGKTEKMERKSRI